MSFETNATIFGDSYGTTKYDKETKTNKFTRLGKAVFVEEIQESIESSKVKLKLCYDYNGLKYATLPRSILVDKTKVTELADDGIDVTLKHFNTFVDTIRLQEQELLQSGSNIVDTYENLGWIELPDYDNDGNLKGLELCYRSHELIGNHFAKYVGTYKVEPMGSFETWREMVLEEVIGRSAAEVVLISSLTSVTVGILALRIPVENPVVRVYFLSGRGKSTLAALGTSVAGQPFQGEKKTYSTEEHAFIKQKSLMQTWASTANAIVTSQAGNRGVPTILDELGKYRGKNPSDVIFNFSEGSDVKRLNSEMKDYISEGYSTVFLSFGESSLVAKCKDKLEGLNVRVLEINKPLTESAKQARRIKTTATDNNGWAAPMLAGYILNNGGVDYVLTIYNDWIDTLTEILPPAPSGERVIEKFYALFMTTAQIATEALNIPFDIDGLLNFFAEHEKENGESRNVSAASYKVLIETFDINSSNFYKTGAREPMREAWGRIDDKVRVKDGKTIIRTYLVRPSIVYNILAENNFHNKENCIAEWEKAKVIERDKDRPTRSRKIEPNTEKYEDVYVFRVFAKDEEADDSAINQKRKINLIKNPKGDTNNDNVPYTA